MKNKTQHATPGQGKSLKNILYVWNAINQNQKMVNPKMVESFGENNIFLIQNKGKGPPGDILHPDHPPDGEAGTPDITPDRVQNPVGGGAKTDLFSVSGEYTLKIRQITKINNTEIQLFNKNRYSKFLQTLNFTNMKKQILFLISLAFFAISNSVYGQWIDVPLTVTALTGCDADPLRPMSGNEYTYSVSVEAPYTATTGYTWYVTQNVTFLPTVVADVIDPAAGLIAIGSGDIYNDPTSTNTIKITWSAAALTSPDPYFLVIQYKAINPDAEEDCEAMNLKVYKIIPQSAFTLDIASMFAPAANSAVDPLLKFNTCSPDIVSASYDGANVKYDFGNKYLYVEVLAANFNESWIPTLTVGTLENNQSIAEVVYNTTDPTFASGNVTMTGSANVYTGAAIDAVNPTNTALGELVYFRVEIANNDWEGISNQDVTVAVDGVDALAKPDLDDATCLPVDGDDVVTQTILARPDIQSTTVATPNDFIPPVAP